MMKFRISLSLIAALSLAQLGCGSGEEGTPVAPTHAEAEAALEKADANDSDAAKTGKPKKNRRKTKTERTPAKAD
jgi:hypothetical protein